MTRLERTAADPTLTTKSTAEREYKISASLEHDYANQLTAQNVLSAKLRDALGINKLDYDINSVLGFNPYGQRGNALIYKILNEGVDGRYSDVGAIQHTFGSFMRGVLAFVSDIPKAAGIVATGTADNPLTKAGEGIESFVNSFFVTDLDRENDFWLTAVPQGIGQVVPQILTYFLTGGAGGAALTAAKLAATETAKRGLVGTMKYYTAKTLDKIMRESAVGATIVPSVFMESFEANVSAGMEESTAMLRALPVTAANTAIERFALDRILNSMIIKNKSIEKGTQELKKFLKTIPDGEVKAKTLLQDLSHRAFYSGTKLGLQYSTGYVEESLQSIITDIGAGKPIDLAQAHFEGLVGGVVQGSLATVGAALTAGSRKQELLQQVFERKQDALTYYNLKPELDERDKQIFDALKKAPDLSSFAKFIGIDSINAPRPLPAPTNIAQEQRIPQAVNVEDTEDAEPVTQQDALTTSTPQPQQEEPRAVVEGVEGPASELPKSARKKATEPNPFTPKVKSLLLEYRNKITQQAAKYHELLNADNAAKIEIFFGQPQKISEGTKNIMLAAVNSLLSRYILDPRTIPHELATLPTDAPLETAKNILRKYVAAEYEKINNKPSIETSLNPIELARKSAAKKFAGSVIKSDFENLIPLSSMLAARAYANIAKKPDSEKAALIDELTTNLDAAKSAIESGRANDLIKTIENLRELNNKTTTDTKTKLKHDTSLTADYAFYLAGLNPLVRTSDGFIGKAQYSIKDGKLTANINGKEYGVGEFEILSSNAIERVVPPGSDEIEKLKQEAIFAKRIFSSPVNAPAAFGDVSEELLREAQSMRFLEDVATIAATNYGYSVNDLIKSDVAAQEVAGQLGIRAKTLQALIKALDEVVPDFFMMQLPQMLEEKLTQLSAAGIYAAVQSSSSVLTNTNPQTGVSGGIYSMPTFELPPHYNKTKSIVKHDNEDVTKIVIESKKDKTTYTIYESLNKRRVSISKDTPKGKQTLVFKIRYNYDKTQSIALESSTTANPDVIKEMASLAAINTSRYLAYPENRAVVEFAEEWLSVDANGDIIKFEFVEDFHSPMSVPFETQDGIIQLSKAAVADGYSPLEFFSELIGQGIIGAIPDALALDAAQAVYDYLQKRQRNYLDIGLTKSKSPKHTFTLKESEHMVAARMAIAMARDSELSSALEEPLLGLGPFSETPEDFEALEKLNIDSPDDTSLASLAQNNLLGYYILAIKSISAINQPETAQALFEETKARQKKKSDSVLPVESVTPERDSARKDKPEKEGKGEKPDKQEQSEKADQATEAQLGLFAEPDTGSQQQGKKRRKGRQNSYIQTSFLNPTIYLSSLNVTIEKEQFQKLEEAEKLLNNIRNSPEGLARLKLTEEDIQQELNLIDAFKKILSNYKLSTGSKGWLGLFSVSDGNIFINASAIEPEEVFAVLDEEIGHAAWRSPEFRALFEEVWQLLTEQEKQEIELAVSQYPTTTAFEESRVKAFAKLRERLRNEKEQTPLARVWQRLVEFIKNIWYAITRRKAANAEELAEKIFLLAVRELEGVRGVSGIISDTNYPPGKQTSEENVQAVREAVENYFGGHIPDYINIVSGIDSQTLINTLSSYALRFSKAKKMTSRKTAKKGAEGTQGQSTRTRSSKTSRAYLRNMTATEALNTAAQRLKEENKLDSLDAKKLGAMIAIHKIRNTAIPVRERPEFRKITKPKSIKAWEPFWVDDVTIAVGDSKRVIAYATIDENNVPTLISDRAIEEEKRNRALNALLTSFEQGGIPIHRLPELPTEEDITARIRYFEEIAPLTSSQKFGSNAIRFGVDAQDVENYIVDNFSVVYGSKPKISEQKLSEVEDLLAYFESLLPGKTIADPEYIGDITAVPLKNEATGLTEPMVVYNPKHLAEYLLKQHPEKRKDSLNRLALHEFIHIIFLRSPDLMRYVEDLGGRLLLPANSSSPLARSILTRHDIINDESASKKLRIGMEGIRAAIEAVLTGQTSEYHSSVDSAFLDMAHTVLKKAIQDAGMATALKEQLQEFFARLDDPSILTNFDKGTSLRLIGRVRYEVRKNKLPAEDGKLISLIFSEIEKMVEGGRSLNVIIRDVNKYYPPSANDMEMAKRNMAARMAISLLLMEARDEVVDSDPIQANKYQRMAVKNLTPTFETASQAGSLLNFWKLLLQRDPDYLYANFLEDLINDYKNAITRADEDVLVVENLFSMLRNQKYLAKNFIDTLHDVIEGLIADLNTLVPEEKKIKIEDPAAFKKASIDRKNLYTLRVISDLMDKLAKAQARLLAVNNKGFNAILRENPLLPLSTVEKTIRDEIEALEIEITKLQSQLIGISGVTAANINDIIKFLNDEINKSPTKDTEIFQILDDALEQSYGQLSSTDVMTALSKRLGIPTHALSSHRNFTKISQNISIALNNTYKQFLRHSLKTFSRRLSPNIKRMALEMLGDGSVQAALQNDPSYKNIEALFYNLIYTKHGGSKLHAADLDKVRNLFIKLIEAPQGLPRTTIMAEIEAIFARSTSANVLDVMNAVRKSFLISGAGTFAVTTASATVASTITTLSYIFANYGSLRRHGFSLGNLSKAFTMALRRAGSFGKQAARGEYQGRYELERIKPILERIASGKQIHGNVAKYLTPLIRPFAKLASLIVRGHNIMDAFSSNLLHDVYIAMAAPGLDDQLKTPQGAMNLLNMDMKQFVELFYDESSPLHQKAAQETDDEIKNGIVPERDRFLRIREKLELMLPEIVLDNARAIGSYVTMMRDITGAPMGGFLGEIGNFINSLKYKTLNPYQRAVVDYHFPYVTSSVNVVNFALNLTPVGLYRTEFGYLSKLSPDLKNMIRLQSIVGTAVLLLMLAAVFFPDDDEDPFFSITGSLMAAGDYRKRRQLLQLGMTPYTIKIGPFKFNYKDILPSFSLVGNIADNVRFKKKGGPTNIAEHLVVGLLQGPQVMMDMTALQTLGSIFGSENVGKTTLERFLQSASRGASSYVVPSFIRDFEAWFYDSRIYEKPENVWGYFLQQFPVVRSVSGSEPLIDIFGNESRNPRNPFGRVFGTSPEKPEEILALRMFLNGYLPAGSSRIIPYTEDRALNRQITIDSLKIFWEGVLADKETFMELEGKTLVKAAKELYKESLREAMEQNGYRPEKKKKNAREK